MSNIKLKMVRVRTSTLLDLEAELKKFAKSLINDDIDSTMRDAFNNLFKTTNVRNTETIIREYITRAEKEMIADGAMPAVARRISKTSIREFAESVLVEIN